MTAVIETNALDLKIGCRYLLKNINWSVQSGEHWVVFGMNGCGKTTLLSIIAGFNNQTHGQISIFGQPFTQQNILTFRQQIGWVSSSFFDKNYSQEAVLNIVLSGKFGTLGLNGAVTNKDILRAKALLEELRLSDKINRPFNLLSKGERQNVLIARAFMGDPKILVLDEPGTGLDIFAREYLLSTIQDLAEQTQMTIIYVTHYTEEILAVFDRCLLLADGRIYQQGATNELFTTENISQFLEYPVRIQQNGGRMQLRLDVCPHLRQFVKGGDAYL